MAIHIPEHKEDEKQQQAQGFCPDKWNYDETAGTVRTIRAEYKGYNGIRGYNGSEFFREFKLEFKCWKGLYLSLITFKH